MKIEKQKLSLPVNNHDAKVSDKNFRKHATLFGGGSKRGLIVGRSGSGKTNLMLSLLEHPNAIRFENGYVYSKSLDQPKYEYLRKLLKLIKEIGYFEYKNDEDIISPHEIKPNLLFLMLFLVKIKLLLEIISRTKNTETQIVFLYFRDIIQFRNS